MDAEEYCQRCERRGLRTWGCLQSHDAIPVAPLLPMTLMAQTQCHFIINAACGVPCFLLFCFLKARLFGDV